MPNDSKEVDTILEAYAATPKGKVPVDPKAAIMVLERSLNLDDLKGSSPLIFSEGDSLARILEFKARIAREGKGQVPIQRLGNMALVEAAKLGLKPQTKEVKKEKETLIRMASKVGEVAKKKPFEETLLRLGKAATLLTLVTSGCKVVISGNTATNEPQTETPEVETYTLTQGKTATATPTETVTPTPTEERSEFINLFPGSIEKTELENFIRLDHYQEDIGRLIERMKQNMPPADQCPSYTTELSKYHAEGKMGGSNLTIENPIIAGVAYFEMNGRKYLVVGTYLHSRDADYCSPILFSIPYSINGEKPSYMGWTDEQYDENFSLFANDEANFKKIINNDLSALAFLVAWLPGNANENSVDQDLWVLDQYNQSISGDIEYTYEPTGQTVFNKYNFMLTLVVQNTKGDEEWEELADESMGYISENHLVPANILFNPPN